MSKIEVSLPGFTGTIPVEFTDSGEIIIAGHKVGHLDTDGNGYQLTAGSVETAMLTESIVAAALNARKAIPTPNPPFNGGGQIPL